MLTTPIIKVNYLVPFLVVKNLPNHHSYLCNIVNTQVFAQLPKTKAKKQYKVGDSDWASVFQIKGSRIILSQKSPAYIRKLLEFVLTEVLIKNQIKIAKIASFKNFFKVLIKSETVKSNKELFEILEPHLQSDKFIEHFYGYKFAFVKYHKNVEDLIKSLLVYEDKITKVVFFSSLGVATVYVEDGATGLVIGEGGRNVVTAKKLYQFLNKSNIEIEIKTI